jgi:hypothetical protein
MPPEMHMVRNTNTTGDEVVDIDSRVDLDLDTFAKQDYPPFRVRVGGQTFSLDQPDAGLVMDLGAARTTDIALALMFDAQWPDVRPLLEGLPPAALVKLTRDYTMHFDIDEAGMALAAATPNREERRARRHRRR